MMTFSDLGQALRATASDIKNNHTLAMSAGLAYYFVLSLFPLLIVLAAITGFLPLPDMWERVVGAA